MKPYLLIAAASDVFSKKVNAHLAEGYKPFGFPSHAICIAQALVPNDEAFQHEYKLIDQRLNYGYFNDGTCPEFEELVANALAEGFELYGPPVCHSDEDTAWCIQALIKKTPRPASQVPLNLS